MFIVQKIGKGLARGWNGVLEIWIGIVGVGKDPIQ